ncbi:hypothetical protein GALMADRAFT_1347078 [Galerina marginata CBS 339.88]|uniref:Uncharacterized protein n=1 Tax=Galerina marginata (strain CBS 339.88) TaxID=685588 RepID=A0A067TH23_GALM3|nr:hypothetical protein GALMADRAFT_1347078 [Galerina marginata CBS 339.88]
MLQTSCHVASPPLSRVEGRRPRGFGWDMEAQDDKGRPWRGRPVWCVARRVEIRLVSQFSTPDVTSSNHSPSPFVFYAESDLPAPSAFDSAFVISPGEVPAMGQMTSSAAAALSMGCISTPKPLGPTTKVGTATEGTTTATSTLIRAHAPAFAHVEGWGSCPVGLGHRMLRGDPGRLRLYAPPPFSLLNRGLQKVQRQPCCCGFSDTGCWVIRNDSPGPPPSDAACSLRHHTRRWGELQHYRCREAPY